MNENGKNVQSTPVKIDWHPGLPIFAAESFLKTMSDQYGWIGGVNESGVLRCILPYALIKKSIFRVIRFPVQTVCLDTELTIEEERVFLNSAVECLRSTGADLIIPATFNTVFRTFPNGAVSAPFGSYIIDLSLPEETLWSNVHAKHRNSIRGAVKKGVKIRQSTDQLATAYKLVLDSFRRSAKGIMGNMRLNARMDYENFRHQALSFGEHVKVFLAEYEGIVQGCAVISFSNYSAYYMHGGSIANPVSGSMNLLQWEAIRAFRALGVKYYDFVGARINPEKGSKLEGIIHFKERFGGRLMQGYMWKFAYRPIKYFLYSLAARLRSGGDVVDQERRKLQRLESLKMEGIVER